MDGSPPEIAIEPSPPDTAMASPPDPSSSTPNAAMEGQGAPASGLAAFALAASGLGAPAAGLGAAARGDAGRDARVDGELICVYAGHMMPFDYVEDDDELAY